MARYCVICGKELIMTGNFMRSDMDEEIESCSSDDSMITYAECPECGARYEMVDCSENERDEDETYVGSMRIWQETTEDNEKKRK